MKQKLSSQQYDMERTVQVPNPSGGDTHVTIRITTDLRNSDVVCSNMGCCFTAHNMRPDEGKLALVQRTIAYFVREQTKQDSQDSDFERHISDPIVRERIAKFRLFTCLVGFVRLLLRDCDWLLPDVAYAKTLWADLDKILTHEDGMCEPESRRSIRRTETLITMCVMEAVARVFLFRQTAWLYEDGRPDPNTKGGRKWEPGMLWDVVRTLHPTRELILYAWSQSLENSIGTSQHGVMVMTALCEKAGLSISGMLRAPVEFAEELLAAPTARGGSGGRRRRRRLEMTLKPIMRSDKGAAPKELADLEENLTDRRIRRTAFRRLVHKDGTSDRKQAPPLREIEAAYDRHANMQNQHELGSVSVLKDALFPQLRLYAMFYKEQSLLNWANGRTSGWDMNGAGGVAEEVQELNKWYGQPQQDEVCRDGRAERRRRQAVRLCKL